MTGTLGTDDFSMTRDEFDALPVVKLGEADEKGWVRTDVAFGSGRIWMIREKPDGSMTRTVLFEVA